MRWASFLSPTYGLCAVAPHIQQQNSCVGWAEERSPTKSEVLQRNGTWRFVSRPLRGGQVSKTRREPALGGSTAPSLALTVMETCPLAEASQHWFVGLRFSAQPTTGLCAVIPTHSAINISEKNIRFPHKHCAVRRENSGSRRSSRNRRVPRIFHHSDSTVVR